MGAQLQQTHPDNIINPYNEGSVNISEEGLDRDTCWIDRLLYMYKADELSTVWLPKHSSIMTRLHQLPCLHKWGSPTLGRVTATNGYQEDSNFSLWMEPLRHYQSQMVSPNHIHTSRTKRTLQVILVHTCDLYICIYIVLYI